jgi:protein-S-isoprenylcysteine O-methyltransferase Ste14
MKTLSLPFRPVMNSVMNSIAFLGLFSIFCAGGWMIYWFIRLMPARWYLQTRELTTEDYYDILNEVLVQKVGPFFFPSFLIGLALLLVYGVITKYKKG